MVRAWCVLCAVFYSVCLCGVRSCWVMMGHRQPSESLSKPLLSLNLCVRVERVRRSWNRDICRNTSAIITPALWSDALYLQRLSSASPFSSIFSPSLTPVHHTGIPKTWESQMTSSSSNSNSLYLHMLCIRKLWHCQQYFTSCKLNIDIFTFIY